MFRKILFNLLYFIFFWVLPFYIVFHYNVKLEDGGYNLNLFGLMFFGVFGILLYRWFNKRLNIWDIQQRYPRVRAIIGLVKAVIFSGLVWWIWEVLYINYENIHLTLMLVFFSILTGSIFRVLALSGKQIKRETN